jgi:hypothetical protein
VDTIAIKNVWFDDAATLVMGEAFDRACKSLRNLGSAVPEIIACLIIQAAKTGERDPARLYGQALKAFRIEDMSIPVVEDMSIVSVGSDLPVPAYASVSSRCRKATGLSTQLFGRNPLWVSVTLAPKHVGRKETSCSYLNSSKESHSRVSLKVRPLAPSPR